MWQYESRVQLPSDQHPVFVSPMPLHEVKRNFKNTPPVFHSFPRIKTLSSPVRIYSAIVAWSYCSSDSLLHYSTGWVYSMYTLWGIPHHNSSFWKGGEIPGSMVDFKICWNKGGGVRADPMVDCLFYISLYVYGRLYNTKKKVRNPRDGITEATSGTGLQKIFCCWTKALQR